jgi:hypothetical protein
LRRRRGGPRSLARKINHRVTENTEGSKHRADE